jgi:hypothetical protein
MRHLVSPNFAHEKLQPPLYRDVVDVFEDRMLYWLLVPAKKLLDIKHGSIAAVALATNYIEGIEIYITGKDSKRRSKEFFCRGFNRIFSQMGGPTGTPDFVTDALYANLRCGFAHSGLPESRITFSGMRKEAITIVWPKKNGQFEPSGQLQVAVVNPRRYVECIELHFAAYMKELRSKKETSAKEKFLSAVAVKWRLGEPDLVMPMTEEQFKRGA